MIDDDEPRSLGESAFTAVIDIADEFVGDLNSFKRLRDFYANETAHMPPFAIERIMRAVEEIHARCESHIEIIALVKMMAMNVANEGAMPAYPFATLKRPASAFVTITPQVEIGPYRADFVVDCGLRHAFVVECDGLQFHDAAKDAARDQDIEARFGMKTFRLTGKEIWSFDNWRAMFVHWCQGRFFDPSRSLGFQEAKHRNHNPQEPKQ